MDLRAGLVFSYSAVACGALFSQQPPYLIQTIAGSAFVGDEGPARSASLAQAEGLAASKSGDVYIAELWHGPTLAFKDLAMQFVGHLLDYFLSRKKQVCIPRELT